MEIEEVVFMVLELKYWERCGGLWFRIKDSEDIFCATCVVDMLEYPAAHTLIKPRLPVNDKLPVQTNPIQLVAIYREGGNA